MPRMGPALGTSKTPVHQKLRSVEDREAETFRDGIDGEDAFHNSWAGSDPDPGVI